MKQVFYCMICLLGLSACSSENFVLEALKVHDVTNSDCSLTLSETDTRNEVLEANAVASATLNIELGKDGTAQCLIEDVKDNCVIKERKVSVTNQDNQITLVVYHKVDFEERADCICNYNVNFKMSKLLQGNYHLKVYYAGSTMKCKEEYLAYDGQVSLATGKTTKVTFAPGLVLPEE